MGVWSCVHGSSDVTAMQPFPRISGPSETGLLRRDCTLEHCVMLLRLLCLTFSQLCGFLTGVRILRGVQV